MWGFDAIVNGISNFHFPIVDWQYKEKQLFFIVTLDFATLINSLISSSSFPVDSLGHSTYKILLSVNKFSSTSHRMLNLGAIHKATRGTRAFSSWHCMGLFPQV